MTRVPCQSRASVALLFHLFTGLGQDKLNMIGGNYIAPLTLMKRSSGRECSRERNPRESSLRASDLGEGDNASSRLPIPYELPH